jgi:hypothetical protein
MSDSRPLGEHERLLHYLHAFGGMIATEVLHVRGPLDPERLREALRFLQTQHPMLRAHVRYGELVFRRQAPYVYRQPYFETDGTTEVPLHFSDKPWEEVMTKSLKTPLPRGRNPRLQLTLISDPADPEISRLLIVADHAAVDAYSVNMMTRQLFEYLADPAGTIASTRPTHTSLPPPLEQGLPKKSGAGTSYTPALRIPPQRVPRARPETRIVSGTIPAPVVDALKASARTKGATLHGVLTAGFFLAMRDVFGVEAMSVLSSFDLRRMSKPPLPNGTFGCYIDIIRTSHKIGDLWPTARDVSFRLISTVAKDHAAASFMQLPTVAQYKIEFWPTLTHGRRIDGLAVTTAGESTMRSRYGNHVIEEVTMGVALDMFGPGLLVLSNEREGALDLSVNYATRAMAPDVAARVTNRAIAILTEAVAENQGVTAGA